MIDKIELRTGNLVKFNESVYVVKRSDLELDDFFTFLEPIDTTTTWLGNFGFERIEPKFGNETYRQPLFKNLFIIMKNGKAFQIVSQIGQNDWQIMGIKIDKVHLLQNKWAILTNIDLKLNLIK